MVPAMAGAQSPWNDRSSPYALGFDRGQRAGIDDARRGDRFDFTDESDYRRGDSGYRNQFGSRQRYREIFRTGYEAGYRSGYGPPNRGVDPGWSTRSGFGYGADQALERGYNDGYEAGLKDGRRGDRPDPIGEGRYRSADRGYNRSYGTREAYKNRYRTAFRQGYEQGYADARRYDRRDRSGWGVFFGFGR